MIVTSHRVTLSNYNTYDEQMALKYICPNPVNQRNHLRKLN